MICLGPSNIVVKTSSSYSDLDSLLFSSSVSLLLPSEPAIVSESLGSSSVSDLEGMFSLGRALSYRRITFILKRSTSLSGSALEC